MNKHAIYHLPVTPWAYARDENTLTLRLRTAAQDIIRVSVFYKDRYDWLGPWCEKDLAVTARTELFCYWTTDLKLRRNRYRYFFELEDHLHQVTSYDEQGFQVPGSHARERSAFQYAYIAEGDLYRDKEHLTEAVVYQIFPERFANGDPGNDPEGTEAWGGLPTPRNSFGGDLRGIIDRMDYLRELGITLLYLTPVFQSTSNHKYNIRDYYDIDPQFGTLDDARELVKKAHQAGIRVFFDAVFNHTGSDFFAFADVLEHQDGSPYYDWYHIDSLPVSMEKVNYYTFANHIPYMPKLRTENPHVREYFYDVGRFWIREIGIDGWRLDVCDEVDHEFWRGFRKACEETDPKSALIGEIMHEASSFLQGKELDAIMNYPFLYAMVDFFARRTSDVHHFMDILAQNRVIYMEQITRQMWNLLDSHDTHRFLTLAKGQHDRLRLASAFQFLYIGTPYIYYGDEVGLDGGYDPYCRQCMIWDEKHQATDLLDHFKAIIRLRRSSPAFSKGSFHEVSRQDHCILFSRRYLDEEYLCAFNNCDLAQVIPIPKQQLTEVTPGQARAAAALDRIDLAPMSFRVFKVEADQ